VFPSVFFADTLRHATASKAVRTVSTNSQAAIHLQVITSQQIEFSFHKDIGYTGQAAMMRRISEFQSKTAYTQLYETTPGSTAAFSSCRATFFLLSGLSRQCRMSCPSSWNMRLAATWSAWPQ